MITGSALDHMRVPRAWTVWVIKPWSKILSMRGNGEAGRKNWTSGRMGDFYVTSEARAGCELAY